MLSKKDTEVCVLEARDRIGGRIWTHRSSGGASIEMGATWLGPQHTELHNLLQNLDLSVFEQKLGKRAIYEPFSSNPPQIVELPPNQESSYRITGGTDRIINRLAGQLSEEQLFLQTELVSIELEDDIFTVNTNSQTFEAQIVVSTLPPRLLSSSISISPALPDNLVSIMEKTHTWMGESIKIGFRYEAPFWRESSGTIFSNVGPISEFYDHSTEDDSYYAIKGFFNPAYHSVEPKERRELALSQLRKYYGNQVDHYVGYEEVVWSKEAFTYNPYTESVIPHQHNGHELYQRGYLNGKFFMAGAETSIYFPGYMEGAVRSAMNVYDRIQELK